MRRGVFGLLAVAALVAASTRTSAGEPFQSVVNSPHNFLARSEAPAGQRLCAACHAGGPSDPGIALLGVTQGEAAPSASDARPPAPLWQRDAATFTVASDDPTAKNAPSGKSAACLGCHDGVLGLEVHQVGRPATPNFDHPYNAVYPRRANGQFRPERPTVNQYRYWSIPDLGPDGFVLPTGPISDRLIIPPEPSGDGTTPQVVRTSDGMVHCDSCHDPHDNGNAPFLRAPARDLCFICHNR
jgi:predicted CXXCH cytochrome family protein